MTLQVHRGDVVRLVVGPKDGSHACDLTHADMIVTETGGAKRGRISKDISGNILEGKPSKEMHGNDAVWQSYSGKVADVAKMRAARSVCRRGRCRAVARRAGLVGARRWPVVYGRFHRQNRTPRGYTGRHAADAAQRSRFPATTTLAEIDHGADGVVLKRHPLGHTVVSADLIMKVPEVPRSSCSPGWRSRGPVARCLGRPGAGTRRAPAACN